jgi:radical SAM superfamily enzyme YgiQ (UPF0313 family)
MKNIVFLEPRSPDDHIFSRYGLPRLGILILGAILENAGYYVKAFVEDVADIDLKEVLKADLVGISTITSTSPRAYEIARLLKKRGKVVVMGGPHVTFLPDEALQYCDFVLRGEAEESILPFMKALETGQDLGQVPGLSFRVGDKFFHNPPASACRDLSLLPFPDFSLLKGRTHDIRPVLTSRGCPYDCSFCSVTKIFGRHYRFRSKESVLRELRAIEGDPLVFFYDDNFTADRKRTKELLRMMIEEKITPKWTAQVRADAAQDSELLELMRDSNCHYVYIGVESVNPETLLEYKKKLTLTQIEEGISRFHDFGIRVHGMFVLGSDQDDVETIRNTARFAKKNRIDTVQFLILTPLPGTQQYQQLKEQGRLLTTDWSLYDGHHVVHEPKLMTPFELQVETMRSMGAFYSIWEIIKVILRFDFVAMIFKTYGHRLQNRWNKRNRYYLKLIRQATASAGLRLDTAARKTAEDIKERLRQITTKESPEPPSEQPQTQAKVK